MNALALGWDTHRKHSKVSLEEMTSEGKIGVVERARLEHCDRQAMRHWLARVPPGTSVALEAGTDALAIDNDNRLKTRKPPLDPRKRFRDRVGIATPFKLSLIGLLSILS